MNHDLFQIQNCFNQFLVGLFIILVLECLLDRVDFIFLVKLNQINQGYSVVSVRVHDEDLSFSLI